MGNVQYKCIGTDYWLKGLVEPPLRIIFSVPTTLVKYFCETQTHFWQMY